ncbi:MAG: hypothetical protein WD076_11930 [Parvularculaceae bacterium]
MTSKVDRLFIIVGLLFAGPGLGLGMYMGISGNHAQMPTHAHIMLAGAVLSTLYGLISRAFPVVKNGVLPYVHFYMHALGALGLSGGLAYIFSGYPETSPIFILLFASATMLIPAWLLFIFLFATRSGKDANAS